MEAAKILEGTLHVRARPYFFSAVYIFASFVNLTPMVSYIQTGNINAFKYAYLFSFTQ